MLAPCLLTIQGDSPTPSCSFRIPGIPFREAAAAGTAAPAQPEATAERTAAVDVVSGVSASAAYSIGSPVASSTGQVSQNTSAAWQHELQPRALQGSGARDSFAFDPHAGLGVDLPPQPYLPGVGGRPKQQLDNPTVLPAAAAVEQLQQPQRLPGDGQGPLEQLTAALNLQVAVNSPKRQQTATAPASARPASVNAQQIRRLAVQQRCEVTTAGDVAAAATFGAPSRSRLSWLMRENVVQLQQLLEQPQRHATPQDCEQQPQQQQEREALQHRLSILLQRNQQQLHELLNSHCQEQQQQRQQQQVHQQHQEPLVPEGLDQQQQQRQQGNPEQQLPHMLQKMQQQLAQLQLLMHQQPEQQQQQQGTEPVLGGGALGAVIRETSGATGRVRQRVTAKQAASASAASRRRQQQQQLTETSAQVRQAAAAAAGRQSASPGRSSTRQARPGAAAGRSGSPPLPVARTSPARKSVADSAGRAVLDLLEGVSNIRSSASRSPPQVRRTRATAEGSAASASGQGRTAPNAAAVPAGGQVQAWRGLQAAQQQRWQQRLQVGCNCIRYC